MKLVSDDINLSQGSKRKEYRNEGKIISCDCSNSNKDGKYDNVETIKSQIFRRTIRYSMIRNSVNASLIAMPYVPISVKTYTITIIIITTKKLAFIFEYVFTILYLSKRNTMLKVTRERIMGNTTYNSFIKIAKVYTSILFPLFYTAGLTKSFSWLGSVIRLSALFMTISYYRVEYMKKEMKILEISNKLSFIQIIKPNSIL
ncbi:MAG: hypothetical protein R2685_02530 [Candidatus Nitrosocosmicus sp.]|nr:hypothetical protein [Candidatus Nitrosocosmicus sp.]